MPPGDATWSAIEAEYFSAFFAWRPVTATLLGDHGHDGALPDFGDASVADRVAMLVQFRKRVAALDSSLLTVDERFDRRILANAIEAELLELSRVKSHRKNPMLYNRIIGRAVSSLIDRDFAPMSVRLAALSSRMEALPAFLSAARHNLDDVPPLWAEMAVKLTRGTVAFLRTKLPRALAEQGVAAVDAEPAARWQKAHATAVAETDAFADWLERDLLPRASGNFRLSRELFERKLRYEEHIELDVDELRKKNTAAIARYRAWVDRVAKEVDPNITAAEVMATIVSDHPTAEELLPAARKYVVDARDFIRARGILTLPTETLPTVRPTPEYARTGFASMSTPGPFEQRATEAYYNVTNVDPAWSKEKQEQHLTYFNHPGLLGISVHEAMPGHFVQLLYANRRASRSRRAFQPASMTEGWAHYCEQMMVDEGLGDGDPRVRLGQLRRALQRHARWHAGIALHVDGRSVEEVAKEFQEIAFFAPFPAVRETRRGTYNPTYLYYALGRMQILELRDDYRAALQAAGREFSLREFHDRFLELALPISLSRQAMLR